MLDSNFKATKQERKEFPLIPADVYHAKVLDISSKTEESYNSKMGKTEGQEFSTTLTFKFELLDNGQVGQIMWSNYIPSDLWVSPKTGKCKLFKIVEALIARDLTPNEIMTGLSGDNLNSLVDKTCRVLVEHTEKNGKVYANITNWMKLSNPLLVKAQELHSSIPVQNTQETVDVSSIPF